MKLVEALKKIKSNKDKIFEIQEKISKSCSNLSHETPQYGAEGTKKKIEEWLQACDDLSQENVTLYCNIQRTNLTVNVPIELGGKTVTKSIAAWIWRRKEYHSIDYKTWSLLGDRNLKEQIINTSTGLPFESKIVRHFDPVKRDNMLSMYRAEKFAIDSALEVVNAVTDLIFN